MLFPSFSKNEAIPITVYCIAEATQDIRSRKVSRLNVLSLYRLEEASRRNKIWNNLRVKPFQVQLVTKPEKHMFICNICHWVLPGRKMALVFCSVSLIISVVLDHGELVSCFFPGISASDLIPISLIISLACIHEWYWGENTHPAKETGVMDTVPEIWCTTVIVITYEFSG